MADNKKEFIPALGHDWLTRFYDLTIRVTMPEGKFRNKLMDFLYPLDGEQILEFGFGTGQNLILANGQNGNAHYVGLDIDPRSKILLKRNSSKMILISNLIFTGAVFFRILTVPMTRCSVRWYSTSWTGARRFPV